MVVIDFETEAIVFGSGRAPCPVGVAISTPGSPSKYYAWGHPTGNNSTYEQAKTALTQVWDQQLVFHNCKFDIAVAMEHFGLPWPKRYHDTMYLLFLADPLAPSLSLKPSAERLLGLPPDEQDAVGDWLKVHGVVPMTTKNWGAHISKAPAQVVAPYAIGDVDRTRALFEFLLPKVNSDGMTTAYERELNLTPILYHAERVGVRINREILERDMYLAEQTILRAEHNIRRLLKDDSLDLNKPAQIAAALEKSGLSDSLPRTPTGRVSTARKALIGAVRSPELLEALKVRGALHTLHSTFMKPWLEMSEQDGHLHPSWNNVRGEDYGTRTGRLSCSTPNLQNVPTEFDIPDLPFMRRYILPDEGHVLIPADYDGQEMRLLAHFAEGKAAEIYSTDPSADFHQIAAELVRAESGLDLKRKQAKITGFSLIYGAGAYSLAEQLGVEFDVARHIRDSYLKAIPGLGEFQNDVSARDGVRTWGGRWVPVEPSKYVDGRWRDFGYKLCNYLIQGSAADQTKQSIIEYNKEVGNEARFLMTVHDENVISVPNHPLAIREEVSKLRRSMENLPGFDVPFVAKIKIGPNWHDLEKYE